MSRVHSTFFIFSPSLSKSFQAGS